MVVKTYNYRLRPNKTQKDLLCKILNQQRFIYNKALEQRIKAYKRRGEYIPYVQQAALFNKIRKLKCPNVNSSSMQQMLRRLDKAFKAFFRRVKAGDKPGFPRFKNASRFNSIEFTYNDGCKLLNNKKVRIQHVGEISVKLHRDIPQNSKIKHVVIKRVNDKWYANFSIEIYNTIETVSDKPPVGIDVGISHLATLSDGTVYDSPKYLNNSLKELRVIQRSVSRKVKGSNSRKKTVKKLINFHEHIKNQRKDFLHKTTREISNKYGDIFMEDMPLDFMLKNKHLAKHVSDVAIGEFRSMLKYKAEEAGSKVILVNPKNTSQICSKCNNMVKKSLSERTHSCPHCGYTIDRDVNAAQNILLLGFGTSPGALTPIRGVAPEAVCFS